MSKTQIQKKIKLLGHTSDEFAELCGIPCESFKKQIRFNNCVPGKETMATICAISEKLSLKCGISEGVIFPNDFYEDLENKFFNNPIWQIQIDNNIDRSNLKIKSATRRSNVKD